MFKSRSALGVKPLNMCDWVHVNLCLFVMSGGIRY